jgi:hypothetical protein
LFSLSRKKIIKSLKCFLYANADREKPPSGASEVDSSRRRVWRKKEEKIVEKHIIFHYLKLAENNIARSILVQMENYIFKTFVEGG